MFSLCGFIVQWNFALHFSELGIFYSKCNYDLKLTSSITWKISRFMRINTFILAMNSWKSMRIEKFLRDRQQYLIMRPFIIRSFIEVKSEYHEKVGWEIRETVTKFMTYFKSRERDSNPDPPVQNNNNWPDFARQGVTYFATWMMYDCVRLWAQCRNQNCQNKVYSWSETYSYYLDFFYMTSNCKKIPSLTWCSIFIRLLFIFPCFMVVIFYWYWISN